jgi:hypothetical protein
MGGIDGKNIWGVKGVKEDNILNKYMKIINEYRIKTIEMEIQNDGSVRWEGLEIKRKNESEVRRVKDEKGIKIVINVKVMNLGLVGYDGKIGIGKISDLIEEGVDIKMVNIMEM